MATLAEIRQQYPQYSDMSDGALADALYSKFYSDIPRQDFDAKIGLQANTELLGTTPAQGNQPARVTIGTNPQPDRFQQAAIDEQAALKAQGIDPGAGFTRRLAHGATLGADSTILAALETPLEMVKRRTLNPVEGYNFAKAREDQIMGDARKNTGALGTAAEVLGGGVSGAGLASGGVTAARFLAPEAGLLARAGASAADAGAVGGFSGAMEGNGLAERGENALKGAGLGVAIGGLAPFALSGANAIASPIVSNFRARINPEGFAQSQVARGVAESGMTPAQIANEMRAAASEGQGMFTAADAMGNAGQRLLATTARSPGQARTDVVNFLDNRQAGQGRRISNALAEGFDSPQTAAQTEARLTAARGAAADAEYGKVRGDAQAVDMTAAINHIDQIIGKRPAQVPERQTRPQPPAPFMERPNVQDAEGPKAQSLLEFIASKGGLGPDAELNAIGAHGHLVNVGGVGRRKLVKQGGWPLDYAREAAEEAGYLSGTHNGTSTVRELLDAIDAEMRGQRRYPPGHEGTQTRRESVARSEREQHEYDRHIQGLEEDLSEAGYDQLGPDIKKLAVKLMVGKRMDADTAVEHALRQLEQEDNAVHGLSGFPGDLLDQSKSAVPRDTPLPNDSIEAILGQYRRRLARINPNDFSAVQRLRGEMADAAQNAKQNGYGNRARLIGGALRQVDAAMESASAGHLAANRNFAQASRDIAAVQTGRQAATRGRTEDIIPTFQAQSPQGQSAFRAGYVDPLIAQTQGAAFGANKARPLINDAFADEAAVMAPGNPLMQRRIGRENTMFQTRNAATGNSKTVENLNDDAAMGVSPELVGFIGQVLHGNIGGAVRYALQAGSNLMTGNTPAVRQEVANILLQRGPNMNPATLENMVNQIVARMQHVQSIVSNIGRGASGGLAVTGPGQSRQ